MEISITILKFLLCTLLVLIILTGVILAVFRAGGWMTFRKPEAEIRDAMENSGLVLRFQETRPGLSGSISYLSATKQDRDSVPDLGILFVHGSPGAKDAFLPYLKEERLLSRAMLYAMDRPGFGYSGFGKAEPSLKEQAARLIEVVREIGEDRVLLVGHSFGCAVIARAAMDFPGEMDGIHLIAGTIAPEAEPHNWWRKIVDLPVISGLLPVALVTCNREMLPLKSELQLMLPSWNRITCPVTLVHGTSDWIVNFRNLPLTSERLTHAKNLRAVTLKGEGHMILWQRKELMVDEIIKTISMIVGGSASDK